MSAGSADPGRGLPESTQRRLTAVDLWFVGIAVASGLVLLYLGRTLTFWHDEWHSIAFDGGPLDYLRPMNQHWTTLPLLLYRATFGLVGLRSYVPYLGEVVILHLLAVGGAYALLRRRAHSLVALAAVLPLLLLGSGAENLFWGFQTGFVGSVLFGVWALFFVERSGARSAVVASLLLLAAVASSGMGLFFVVACFARTLLDARLRRRVVAAVVPLGVYALWLALLGRHAVSDDRVFLDPSVGRFLVRGILHASTTVSGLVHVPDGHFWGMALFLGLASLVVYRSARGRTSALAVACLLGVVALYLVVALGRVHADPGYDHATASRFVYVAAFFLVIAVVDLLPGRDSWPAWRSASGFAAWSTLALVVALVTVANLVQLRDKRAEFEATADHTRAFVQVALARGHEPWVDRHEPRGWMPSVAELEQTVARHGSPLVDELFPGVATAPDARARETALLALAGAAYRLETPRGSARFALLDVETGAVSDGRCARASLAPGRAAWLLGLPSRSRVRISWSANVFGRVFLSHEGGASRPLYSDFKSGTPMDVMIPYVGDARPWTLVLDSPRSSAVVTVCVVVPEGEPGRMPRVAVRDWGSS